MDLEYPHRIRRATFHYKEDKERILSSQVPVNAGVKRVLDMVIHFGAVIAPYLWGSAPEERALQISDEHATGILNQAGIRSAFAQEASVRVLAEGGLLLAAFLDDTPGQLVAHDGLDHALDIGCFLELKDRKITWMILLPPSSFLGIEVSDCLRSNPMGVTVLKKVRLQKRFIKEKTNLHWLGHLLGLQSPID